jgi:hypothetical protein
MRRAGGDACLVAAAARYLCTITDQSGRTVVDEVSQGPWMFVDLPPGSYTVKATLGDRTQSQNISVREGSQRTVHFRWPDASDQVAVHTAGR